MRLFVREWKRNGRKAKVFVCSVMSQRVCVCVSMPRNKAAAARIKARAVGLLLAFFRPPDACHCFQEKKRAEDEEGRRTKRGGGHRCSNHVT